MKIYNGRPLIEQHRKEITEQTGVTYSMELVNHYYVLFRGKDSLSEILLCPQAIHPGPGAELSLCRPL